MRLSGGLYVLLVLLPSAFSLKLTNGHIKSNNQNVKFSLDAPSNIPIVLNDTLAKFEINYSLTGLKRQPEQQFVQISNKNGLQASYKPIVKLNDDGSFTQRAVISYKSFPTAFKSEKELLISLIVASTESQDERFYKGIGAVTLSELLRSKSTHTLPERYGVKEEIHHIFQQPPKTVNPAIASAFSAASVAVLVLLLLSWAHLGLLNLSNLEINLSNVAFVGLIIAYEAVFFQYYAGSSIFQTISKGLILLGPTVWFGSKVLNKVGELRLAGKR